MVFPSSLTTVDYGITSMKFHLESETVSQTAENLKGRTWNGNGDMNLYCFETSVFTISFRSEGTLVEEITTGKNGQLTKTMPIPENPGYVFKGWYNSIPGGHLITQDWIFTKNSNVYADWEKAVVPVTGVKIDTPQVTLTVGRYTLLSAEIQPTDATDHAVSWESSNPSVATVDQYGYVQAISEGKAEITVTTHDGGFTAKCTVTVSNNPQPSPGGGGDNGALIVIIVIIVIAAVAGGFYYWKKKQQ